MHKIQVIRANSRRATIWTKIYLHHCQMIGFMQYIWYNYISVVKLSLAYDYQTIQWKDHLCVT